MSHFLKIGKLSNDQLETIIVDRLLSEWEMANEDDKSSVFGYSPSYTHPQDILDKVEQNLGTVLCQLLPGIKVAFIEEVFCDCDDGCEDDDAECPNPWVSRSTEFGFSHELDDRNIFIDWELGQSPNVKVTTNKKRSKK